MKAFLYWITLFFTVTSFSQTKESFSVYFDSDKYTLNNKELVQLDSFWRSNQKATVFPEFELKGFCDNRGTDKYNYALSDKRVAAVKTYLLKKGVNIEIILTTLGFGENSPINENRTEEERQLNRRVDIIIIKNSSSSSPDKGKSISLKQKIADTSITAGTNIILRNINFVGGMHQFLPESTPVLEELLDALRTYPKLIIRVEGHICCQPDSIDGLDAETGILNLSEARAKAVRDYLVENNIDISRVAYKGFGHSSPLFPYPEKTEEERTQNRRVEIKIISK